MQNDLQTRVMELEHALNDIKVQLAMLPKCPAPGTCLQLTIELERTVKIIEAINNRLSALERAESRLVGIFAAIMVLGGAMGAVIHSVLNWTKK
jgi:hypothetical protein